jgi:hypothetical protein
MAIKPKGVPVTPSGEGERRAQRGYQQQYAASAPLVYYGLKNDVLEWVGVADRSAGVLDDLVLGLAGRVVGHQFKSSQFDQRFTIKSLLLGTDNLLAKLAASWRLLCSQFPNANVELQLVALNHYPSSDDELIEGTGNRHTSAFVRELRESGPVRSLSDWQATPWWPLIERLTERSALDNSEFERFLQAFRLLPNPMAAILAGEELPPREQRQVHQIARTLSELVTDNADRDRWSREELLARLGWIDTIGNLRRSHQFPIGTYVQRNIVTERKLLETIRRTTRGYISLLGPPGAGKSTLLQTAVLPADGISVVRYLAFMPSEGLGLGRAEAEDFLRDLIILFQGTGLQPARLHVDGIHESREQLERLLAAASARFKELNVRTVVVIDGLDHIPREERPVRSLLLELPQPGSIPDGVVFVLGSQSLSLPDVPPAVRDQAGSDDRTVSMEPLSRKAVHRFADDADLQCDVDRDVICDLSGGHPLALRYLVQLLKQAPDYAARQSILSGDFTYAGDVVSLYDRVWHAFEADSEAWRVLDYVARAEGPIDPNRIATIISADAVDRAYRAVHHLLAINGAGRWQIFHNSFRLYVLDKPHARFGRRDETYSQRIYGELADLARDAPQDDPQHWLELRYRARAGDHDEVAKLISPGRFRGNLEEGRSAADIQADIRLAFNSAHARRDVAGLVGLFFSRHEIDRRAGVLTNATSIVDAYLALEDIDSAIGILKENRNSAKRYEIVDALVDAGRIDDARYQFDEIEPLGKLFGTDVVAIGSAEEELFAWARHAHRFRDPDQILVAIAHLTGDQRFPTQPADSIEQLRRELRCEVAQSALAAAPEASPDSMMRELAVDQADRPSLLVETAWASYHSGDLSTASAHLEEVDAALDTGGTIPQHLALDAAWLKMHLGDMDGCRRYYDRATPPTMATAEGIYTEHDVRGLAREVINHAALGTILSDTAAETVAPGSRLLRALQNHLRALGQAIGRGQISRATPAEVLAREIQKLLAFLSQARAESSESFYHAHQVRYCAPTIGDAIVEAAFAHGREAFDLVMQAVDTALSDPASEIRGWSEFRRRITLRAYHFDKDELAAACRLEACLTALGNAGTPDEQVDELAKMAKAFAIVGQAERAREILKLLHNDTLGYALAPKKDPQYAFWRDVFDRACSHDPMGRPARVQFFARLIAGMGETEGRSAAYRLTSTVLRHAALASPNLGARVASLFETEGLTDWTEMVHSLLLGLIERRPELALVATHTWARLVLPYYREPHYAMHSAEKFIQSALELVPEPQVRELSELLRFRVESESSIVSRIALLRSLRDATRARQRDVAVLERSIARWQPEAPPDREGRSDSSPDPFGNVQSLLEFGEQLSSDIPPEAQYRVSEALLRLLPTAKLVDAQTLIHHHPELLADLRVVLAVARLAVRESQSAFARGLLGRHRPSRGERAYWDTWRGGVKLDYYRCLIELEGNPAREQAFAELAKDLSQGREWSWSLLIELPDIVDLLAPSTDWAAIWALLAEQLESFRDYRASGSCIPPLVYPTTDEESLAYLYEVALSLQVPELSRHARLGAFFGRTPPGGRTVLFALLDRLFNQSGDGPCEALALIRAGKHDEEIKHRYEGALQDWVARVDLAFIESAKELAKSWGKSITSPQRPPPAFYTIVFEDNQEAEQFTPPMGHGARFRGITSDDLFDWTWAFENPLRALSEAAGVSLMQLRRRCHQFMSEEGGLAAFGSGAQSAIESRLDRLELRLSFNRPHMRAAIRALRRVVAELMQAGRLEQSAIPILLYELGAPAIGELMIEPTARPAPIPRPDFSNVGHSEEQSSWLDAASWDARPLQFGEESVLLEISCFEHNRFDRRIAIERVSAHGGGHLDCRSAERAVAGIPRTIDFGTPVPIYRGPSRHFVALMDGTFGPTIPKYMPIVCPLWSRRLGWSPHPANRFVYQDSAGTSVARTIWWRDGGPRIHRDDSVRGEGFLVLLTLAGRRQLESLAGQLYVEPLCWRSIENEREDAAPLIRHVGPPSFH